MLLQRVPLYNRDRFSSREPGPDQVPHPPKMPDEVGADIIEDELWPSVGGDELSSVKRKEGEPLLSHNYRS
jgi:hypothetical protein